MTTTFARKNLQATEEFFFFFWGLGGCYFSPGVGGWRGGGMVFLGLWGCGRGGGVRGRGGESGEGAGPPCALVEKGGGSPVLYPSWEANACHGDRSIC